MPVDMLDEGFRSKVAYCMKDFDDCKKHVHVKLVTNCNTRSTDPAGIDVGDI